MKSSSVITIDKIDIQAKGRGQGSKVKVREVKTHFAQIWAFADCNSSLYSQMAGYEMMHKTCSGIEDVP